MNREEKLQYQEEIESYFEENRVYDIFEKLLKELVIFKPKDPIDYLIDRLKKPDTKRYFITSGPGNERKEIALAVANELGFKHISMGDLIQKELLKKLDSSRKIEKKLSTFNLVDDEIAIELFKNEAVKYKDESYIVEGFPRNRVQTLFLKSVGLIPDSVVVLNTSRQKEEEQIKVKLRQAGIQDNLDVITKNSVDESELGLSAVKDVYRGFLCEISTVNKNQNGLAEEISVSGYIYP
jgi:adenylate kinase